MAKIDEGIVVGIGVQDDQATVNEFAIAATNVTPAAASSGLLTGILLRSPEDMSKAFERIEADGGVVPGSLTRQSGAFIRTEPTVSLTIDAMGPHKAITPSAGEFNYDEYFERILAGARLVRESVPTITETAYELGASSAGVFHTIKIWRGSGSVAESWVLVGCTFNLVWNFAAGEKTTIDVEVAADSVIYQGDDIVFPVDPDFGNQVLAAPILQLAGNELDGNLRGFQTGTLTLAYPVNEVQDTNATGGIIKSQGTPREVAFEAVYFRDTLTPDHTLLEADFDGVTAGPKMEFTLGQVATAPDVTNSQQFLIPRFRITNTDMVPGDQVLRTITGYGSADSASPAIGANQELLLSSV